MHRQTAQDFEKCKAYYKNFLRDNQELLSAHKEEAAKEKHASKEKAKTSPTSTPADAHETEQKEIARKGTKPASNPAPADTPKSEQKDITPKEAQNPIEDLDVIADKLYIVLKKECELYRYGANLTFLAKRVGTTELTAKKILLSVEWARMEYGRFLFNHSAAQGVFQYNFEQPQSLAFSKPVSVTYFGEIVSEAATWKQAFVDLMHALYDDYPHIIEGIKGKVLDTATIPIVVGEEQTDQMCVPREFAEGLFVETKRSAKDLLANLKRIIDACNIDYENVVINFERREEKKKPESNVPTKPAPQRVAVSPRDTVGIVPAEESNAALAETSSGIAAVLKQYFEYGFKYGSIRETMRFRQFADAMGIEIPEDDDVLKASILAAGTVIDDKVYCKNDDVPQDLRRFADEIFSSGVGAIYYESLFEKKQEWMESHAITTPDMLKEYLRINVTGCSFSKKFFALGSRQTEREIVADELKRVWGERPIQSVNELHSRLPYIPLGNIWRVISGNELFVLTSEGEYLLLDRFNISLDDQQSILDYVEATCEEKGFASLSDVPLGSIEEENFEVPQFAVYNAVFKKVLLGKYFLNGKIITKGNPDLDTITLLKQHIREKNECSFDEVADKVVELTGDTNRQYAFRALYDEMVRVDRNKFVANKFVNFNVDEIDALLSDFITEEFRAIRDITTFAMFPICGQNWNHYLLESFCYKYSKKFSLHIMNFNDKNAGIIADKGCCKQYNEMLAIALAQTDVELTPDVIGQYLFNTGYMAKSKYAKLGEIAQRASELRKER